MSRSSARFGAAILMGTSLSVLVGGGSPFAATSAASSSHATASAKTPAMVMPWIEDDYAKAISEAKARKLPVFVESWAPW